MSNLYKSIFVSFFFVFAALCAHAQFYYGSQQEFGKNRVQYNGFLWQTMNYERFKIYFYQGGKTHAIYIAQAAHKQLKEIERLFDYYIEDKLEFIIYNTQEHFKQSNIGLSNDEQFNVGGVTRIVGNKVFLFYEGDHNKLDKNIRAGIASVLLNQMMYGGNWREVWRNSTLLTLPEWYSQGFISFISSPWDIETENIVKDGILSGKYNKFNLLSGDEAKYAGHAIWRYIAEVYGESVIPNILYMTRVSRNIESGFLFVLGASLKTISYYFIDFWERRFKEDESLFQTVELNKLDIKFKKRQLNGTVFYQYKTSPNGKYAAFVSNQMGQYKIWLYDKNKKKLSLIAKGGVKINRINNYTQPVLGWHPNSSALTYIEEKKGNLNFCVYETESKKTSKRPLQRLEKVLSYDYSEDGKNIVFSAVNMGQTDLFLFKPLSNNIEQLTNDIYDDLHPKFIQKDKAIVFASNRPNDSTERKVSIKPLDNNNKDIYTLTLTGNYKKLTRITNTPFADESYPTQTDSINFTYLSDENGIINRYKAYYDSAISYVDTAIHYEYFSRSSPLTNFNRNILEYDLNEKNGNYGLLILHNNKYHFYEGQLKNDVQLSLIPDTRLRWQEKNIRKKSLIKQALKDSVKTEKINIEIEEKKKTDTTRIIDINNYRFEDDEKPKYEKQQINISATDNKTDTLKNNNNEKNKTKPDEFVVAPLGLYKVNFATEYVVTQIDNSFLNPTYQRFTGVATPYFNPGISPLLKLSASDVFEDYKITGGIRFAGNFSNNEILLGFDNLRTRLDKRIVFYRQSLNSYSRDFNITKTHTHEARYILKYPFSEVFALRTSFNYRNDRIVYLSTDFNNLHKPNEYYHLAGAKAELIYDNTIRRGINTLFGFRGKIFGEYYREIINNNGNFIVLGLDLRHYQKISKDFIWANRLAASASLGNRRLLYYLGGVDNWFIPQFNNQLQIPVLDSGQIFTHQAIATPMRGFIQNSRNGTNFLLYNSELRFPLFKYFSEKPLRSDFLENFQLIGFFDLGLAWTGWNPYSEDNSFNTTIIYKPGSPIYVTLYNQREPIIFAYGWGLRSRILGYFVRFDWGIGWDDGVKQTRRFFSFSLDF
jgi:hypothetical protein